MGKKEYDKALARLVMILQKLYEGEHLSVLALAQEFNVSTRTITRDFGRLSWFHIENTNRIWKMRDGFSIEKISSPEESCILDILEKVSQNLGENFAIKAKSLLSKIKNANLSSIYAKLDIENISANTNDVILLENAIAKKIAVSFIYENITFAISPLRLANFDGFWYLVGIDNNDKIIKKFHLKSINDIRTLNSKFITPTKENLNEKLENAINIWFQPDNEIIQVILEVDNEIIKYFERKPISNSQKILEQNDKTSKLSILITHQMELIPTILKWIPHIRVVEPAWLGDEIEEKITKYLHLLRDKA
jgi:predicted DNA-binding transcriptional regulator YafY